MRDEEQEVYYGLDPRAGLWKIWADYFEAKERTEETALLARTSSAS